MKLTIFLIAAMMLTLTAFAGCTERVEEKEIKNARIISVLEDRIIVGGIGIILFYPYSDYLDKAVEQYNEAIRIYKNGKNADIKYTNDWRYTYLIMVSICESEGV